jgi:hypothetical protein
MLKNIFKILNSGAKLEGGNSKNGETEVLWLFPEMIYS